LQPVMMRGMDQYCCGSIRGRGAHYAKRAIERWLVDDVKGTRHEFCGDIRHFYDSLKPEVVMGRMRQLVKDYRVLDLVWRVIKDGVKIGAYPSQWFANTVLQPLDTMIRQSGLCAHYARYMDNLTVFGSNKRKLRKLKDTAEAWLNSHGLELKGDWQIFQVAYENRSGETKGRMPDAVGYKYGRGYTLPRKHNLIRIKRAIRRYRKKRESGYVSPKMAHSTLSRLGQIHHCSNYNLYKQLYKGERIERELKGIIRRHREEFTWSMYLEQRAIMRPSGQRAVPIPT